MSSPDHTPPDEVDPTESTTDRPDPPSAEEPTPAPSAGTRGDPDDDTGPAAEPDPHADTTGSTDPADPVESVDPADADELADEDKAVDGDKAADPDDQASQQPARRRLTGRAAAPGLLIGVLCALLGFGLAVQVRTTSSTSGLSGARQEDLVRILDDLSSREDRLRQQISSLDTARSKLSSSGDKASVALSEARNRSTTLGILAGTVPAQGPGIRLIINDPAGELDSENLLDAVEELRAAGGEAFQVGKVRIGVSTAFTDQRGRVVADGTPLDRPYVILAIGDPGTLATALNIPGGVVASVRNAGGQATITQEDRIVISALRQVTTPDHAKPATEGDN